MNTGMHSGRKRAALVAMLAGALALQGCWKVDADLKLSTHRLDFGATRDRATFKVVNDSKDNALTAGVMLLDYQMKVDHPWVTVTPMAGRCGAEEVIEHTVTIDRSALPDGESLATIRITSNGGSDDVTVRATQGVVAGCNEQLTALVLSSPDDGATGVALDVNITWSGGESQCEGRTSTYDVYFGNNSSPPLVDNVSSRTFDVGNLAENTTYYWKVRASDGVSTRISPVRHFKTVTAALCTEGPAAPGSLVPSDDARDVPVNQDLSWSGGESRCAGQTATYDVYFGTSSPAPLAHKNGTSKTWDPGTLRERQTYYWRVVAKDANGSSSSGERQFTTLCGDESGATLTAPCSPSPANNKDKVNPKATLTWGCGVTECDQEVTFTVYLGTSSGLDDGDVVATTTAHSFKPPALRGDTTYYWKVVARAGATTRPGPTWRFKTRD